VESCGNDQPGGGLWSLWEKLSARQIQTPSFALKIAKNLLPCGEGRFTLFEVQERQLRHPHQLGRTFAIAHKR
jgi:hypothetical protein